MNKGTLLDRANATAFRSNNATTAANEPMVIDLPSPNIGSHWVLQGLSLQGVATVFAPRPSPLTGLYLVPNGSPVESAADVAALGFNPQARAGVALPILSSNIQQAINEIVVLSSVGMSSRAPGVAIDADGWVLDVIVGANPVAGVEFSITVPPGEVWEFLAIKATLATNGTITNRSPNFIIDDGANTLVVMASALTEVATSSMIWSAYPGASSIATPAGASNTMPGPIGMRMQGGFRIRSSTVNFQAGDQWTAIELVVRVRRAGAYQILWDRNGDAIVPAGWHARAIINAGSQLGGPGAGSTGLLTAWYSVENDALDSRNPRL